MAERIAAEALFCSVPTKRRRSRASVPTKLPPRRLPRKNRSLPLSCPAPLPAEAFKVPPWPNCAKSVPCAPDELEGAKLSPGPELRESALPKDRAPNICARAGPATIVVSKAAQAIQRTLMETVPDA